MSPDFGLLETWQTAGYAREESPLARIAVRHRCGRFAAALVWTLLVSVAGTTWNGVRAAELVMFESANCDWCELWQREVGEIYDKTSEAAIAPLRRVDIGAPRPADLSDIRGVVYTPTFVLMDGGQEVGRILGYPGEAHFWGLLDLELRKLGHASEG